MQILSTADLTKSYKGRKVVDDISLRIAQGEVVGLLGPNGAGKTTTFYIIVGLTSPDSGQVLLDGVDITNFPDVPPGERRHQLPPSRALHFPQTHGGREYNGGA